MYWNKRFLLIIALLFLVFGNVLAQSPYRIRLADSTYAAQLRGVTGTRTAGITITGTYKSNFRAHQFNVTTTGRYDLYIDATGTGSSYSKDAVWSGTVGKTVVGKTDLERTVSLGVYADPDSNAQIDTQGYEDLSVTAPKLANTLDLSSKTIIFPDSQLVLRNLTTAAYNFVGSGGSVTNNPDDESVENKTGSTIGIKETYFTVYDTTTLKTLQRDSVGMIVNLKQLSSSNTNGGGIFVYADSSTMRSKYGSAANLVSYSSTTVGKRWYIQEFIESEIVRPEWFGANGYDTASDSLAFQKALAAAYSTTSNKTKTILLNGDNYYINGIDFNTVGYKFHIKAENNNKVNLLYNGVGGAGSYMFNFAFLSYGGFENVVMVGYSAQASDTVETLVKTASQYDLQSSVKNVQFTKCTGDAWVHTGGITNLHWRHWRADGIKGYILYIDAGAASGLERRPLVLDTWTIDNASIGGDPGTGGVLKIDNPGGIFVTLSNARIEMNKKMGANEAIVKLTTVDDYTYVKFDNIVGYTSTYSQLSKNYAVSSDGAKVQVDFENSKLDNIYAILHRTDTDEYFGTVFDTELQYTYGGNVTRGRGFNVNGKQILGLTRTQAAASNAVLLPGDLVLNTAFQFPNFRGVQMVVYPDTGYSQPVAQTLTTVGVATATNNYVKMPVLNILYPNSNIKITGANYNGGNLFARVDSIDYTDSLVYINKTIQTTVNPATVNYVASQFRDITGLYSSTEPVSGNWKAGEIIWDLTPVSGSPIGWVCTASGKAHAASTGTITNSSASVSSVTNVSTWAIGDIIKGHGIPANTIITNISGTTITMSANATADSTGNALYDAQFKTWGAIY